MCTVVSIELVWHYTPVNYFLRPLTIPVEGGQIRIAEGQISATIDSFVFNGNNGIIEMLDDLVENQFSIVQHKTHQPYELSQPLKIEVRDDGSEKPCLT